MSNVTVDDILNSIKPMQEPTIQKAECKCGKGIVLIAETLSRDYYKVGCQVCKKETEWFRNLDDAIKSWNEEINK